MTEEKKKNIRSIMAIAALAAFLVLLAGMGVLKRLDLTVCDLLYQRGEAFDGEIVLVGIDKKALEEFGPYNEWNREIMARLLEALNKSEDCHPAVIGIDVLYAGESEEEADTFLARAAAQYGNVVSACAAEFEHQWVWQEDGSYTSDSFAITAFEEPYLALNDVSAKGHINMMLDQDGFLRHHLLEITLPDGEKVPSFALRIAEKYKEVTRQESIKRPSTNHRGFWYLPFCGRPGALDESISVADVISGRVSAEHFSGKIVLIGPYTAGLQDGYLTAIDHAAPMYGVEYHANAIQALLWERYKTEAKDNMQLLLLYAVLVCAGISFWRFSVRSSSLLWAGLCGGWPVLCFFVYQAGVILHVLWIPVGVTVLYAGSLIYHYLCEAWRRRQVIQTFQKYVAPEIVEELLKKGIDALKPGGEAKEVAVLFVDIRGFTTLSERLDAGEVAEILNQCLPLFAQCIMDHGGTLDKFIGDAAMAFWNAPLPREDYVMDALKAAMDMAAGAEGLSDRLRERFPKLANEEGRILSFGIGIHMGKAVVGNVGSPKRMDYTVIGDTVNTTSRIESETGKRLREGTEDGARGSVIYISREVADALEGRIEATSLGPIALKGKAASVEILRVEKLL